MDGSDVVGATQIIATMLVFLAVERRVVPVPEADPEKRSGRIRRDSFGLSFMAAGILVGGIDIPFTSGPPAAFTRWVLAAAFVAAVVMTLSSITRAWGAMERRSYLQEREDRNKRHKPHGDDDVPD